MANWGQRVRAYKSKLKTLQQQGWLSPQEVGASNLYSSDTKFQRLISLGQQRKAGATAAAKHQAGLKRTGGLPRPGTSIDTRYYERFLGISKSDLEQFKRVPVWTRKTSWREGRGMVDKYRQTVPEIEYVIRQRWEAAYDPKFTSQQLKGSSKWDIQSASVDKFVNAVKRYYSNVRASEQRRIAQEKARHAPARMTVRRKASRAAFGSGALGMPNRLSKPVSKLDANISNMIAPRVQKRVEKVKPKRGQSISRLKKAASITGTRTQRVTKAKPKAGTRVSYKK